MNTALNRTSIAYLTNKSGGALTYGAVVVLDNTNANGFTTTTSAGLSTRGLGVIFDVAGIANNATGAVAIGGWCPQINLNTASTVGQFIKTHTVAGQGTPHSSQQVEGDFAVALTASATPSAMLFGGPNAPISAGTVTNTGTLTNDTVILGNAGVDITSLANGTAGQVLTMNASATAPEWAAASGGGGLVLLEQHTASASASLDFTAFLSSTYDTYQFELLNVLPATTTADLWMRAGTGAGPTWDTGGNYTWAYFQYSQIPNGAHLGSAADTKMKLGNSLIDTATKGASGHVELFSPESTSVHKQFTAQLTMTDSSGNYVGAQVGSIYLSTTALTGVQFLFSSGNITSGTIRVYGLEK